MRLGWKFLALAATSTHQLRTLAISHSQTCTRTITHMTNTAQSDTCSASITKPLQPAVFVPHGGGPMPLLGDEGHTDMVNWLQHFQRDFVKTKPDAIVLITAHWEEDVATITSAAAPTMLFDYYGFPPEAYKIKYPAPGHPDLAARIHNVLSHHKIPSRLDSKRGYDHGVFIPLMLMFPAADIPVVQMSVLNSLDPEKHIKLGEALRELRKDNILIIGSGLSFHNFRYGTEESNQASIPFHQYLTESLVKITDPAIRRNRLVDWANAPFARRVHAREEHLLPLHVVAGAALDEPCEEIFEGYVMGVRTSGFLFGKRN